MSEGIFSFANIISVINRAREAVPAVNYALAVAGVAAAGALVIAFVGRGFISVVVLGGMLVAMVLMFVFSRLVTSSSPSINLAGIVMLWAVVGFFCLSLTLTATAYIFGWPDALARLLGIEDDPRKKAEISFRIPASTARSYVELTSKGDVGLVRLQPPSDDPAVRATRETLFRGGGSYYSFVRKVYDYGQGSDIKLEEGQLRSGFTVAAYGFFLIVDEGTIDQFKAVHRAPPVDLDPRRREAWDYVWEYRPPRDLKEIRTEQKKSKEGFSVGQTSLSGTIVVRKGGMYLLRSIDMGRSDILVLLHVADILSDRSVVVAWRILSNFDTPIATGTEG